MSRSYSLAPRGGVIYTGAVLVAALGLFTVPAHAAEPTSVAKGIGIKVDPTVDLASQGKQGDLYQVTTHIKAWSDGLNGFRLTMAASGKDLVKTGNDTYRIAAVSESGSDKLPVNHWGYKLYEYATKFRQIPVAHPLQLAGTRPDDLDDYTSINECEKSVTFAVNINNTDLPVALTAHKLLILLRQSWRRSYQW